VATPSSTLADERVTKARCPHCAHEKIFTGHIIDSLACPKCEAQMTIVATTGTTLSEAADAMDAAAAQLPPEKVERPRQQPLPGLPMLDEHAALEMLFDLDEDIDKQAAKVQRWKDGYDAEKKTLLSLEVKRATASRTLRDRRAMYESPAAAEADERGPSEAPLLGTDASPASEVAASDPSSAAQEPPTLGFLHDLLLKAGADVSVIAMATWSTAQLEEALDWAHAQFDATQRDKPGHHTSVRWPDHVSAGASSTLEGLANEEPEPARVIPKRHAKKTAAQIVGGALGGARGIKAPVRKKGRRK
jgi:hypothetical protein